MIEQLEPRRLFSAAAGDALWIGTAPTVPIGEAPPIIHYTNSVTGRVTARGTLVVRGTIYDDVIGVERTGEGRIVVSGRTLEQNVSFAFDASRVKRVLIASSDGDDRVGVARDIDLRCTLAGGGGNDILGGSAGDTIIGGAGNDRLVAQPIAPRVRGEVVTPIFAREGHAVLTGGAGNDVLVAAEIDTVSGGAGEDAVTLHSFRSDVGLQVAFDPEDYARDHFGPRASGIERFGTHVEVLRNDFFVAHGEW